MSAIEWCDHTVNVQIGCTRVSAGCENCYAERQSNNLASWVPRGAGGRHLQVVDGKGRWNREIFLDQAMLDRGPTTPRRKKTTTGWRPTRVFLGSMTDQFHEKVTIGMFKQVLDFMRQRPRTIWQVVTKRPENAFALLRLAFEQRVHAAPWPRIHLLTTTEDQQRTEERVPQLLKCEPYVELLGLSVEPLLEQVTLKAEWLNRLGWVIVGGESGPKARRCAIWWIRSVVEQASVAGVPVFVKQLGAVPSDDHGLESIEITDIKHPKGGKMAEWPADLQVQEFPR